MPEQETLNRARKDKQQGKAPSTQAGEFVREEMHHIREGKHGARSRKEAMAMRLSKARRGGVELKPPKEVAASAKTRESAERAYRKGQRSSSARPSTKRSMATRKALQRESHSAASHEA